jgi:hypothetical protein
MTSPRGSLKSGTPDAAPAPSAHADAPTRADDLETAYTAAQQQLVALLADFFQLPPPSHSGADDVSTSDDQQAAANITGPSPDVVQDMHERLSKSLLDAGTSVVIRLF